MALRLGLEIQELVGRNLFELFPSDLARERRDWCDKVIHSGKPVRFVDAEAGVYLDNNVHPVLDRDGRVEKLAIFSRDITDQLRAERIAQGQGGGRERGPGQERLPCEYESRVAVFR